MADDQSRDELLRRARELGDKAEDAQAEGLHQRDSAAERFARENRVLGKLSEMAERLGDALGPVGSFLGFVLHWIGRWLRWILIAGPKEGQAKGSRFSFSRTIRNLLISVIAVFGLHVLASAIYYYSTYFKETVYVTGKQEIVTGELYQFGGCTALPCSTTSDNGKFYLIESSLYFPVMLYPEEEVFANVPQQDAACNVEGYGIYFRSLRWIYKTFQLYQHVVDVSCRPYTEEEIRRAVSEGSIVRDEPPHN